MEKNLNQQLQFLASRLNLTGPNDPPEEYILTPKEEEDVVFNAIIQLKQRRAYKLANAKYSKLEIDSELAKINWEEKIDKPELLLLANSRKHYCIWEKDQRKKQKEEEEKESTALKDRCNAKYFYNIMAWVSKDFFNKDLIVHDKNIHLIKTICFFLSYDKRFETELKFSFKKGLLIRGVSGLGKTFLFQCVQNNDLCPFPIYNMIEIAKAVKSEGDFFINKNNLVYIDDAGTEEPIQNHFGTKINFFKNFIEEYYMEKTDYSNLIISTNNSFKEIEEKYGFRVRSRMKDMFNIIDVEGEDMRGGN